MAADGVAQRSGVSENFNTGPQLNSPVSMSYNRDPHLMLCSHRTKYGF